MARVTIQLSDEIHELYESRAQDRKRRIDRLIADELKAIQHLDVANDRVIVIDPKNRQRIETLLGEGHVLSAADLADKLERLLSIRFGGIDMDFTPAQRQELVELAERNGFEPEDLFRATVRSMEELFFGNAYDEAARRSEERRSALPPEPPPPPTEPASPPTFIDHLATTLRSGSD